MEQRKCNPPAVTYYVHPSLPSGRILRFNASAARLLGEGGEAYAIITYRDSNGNLFIKPINVDHGEIISVNKIRKPLRGHGQIKLGATKLGGDLPLGTYEVVWDGMREALRIRGKS